MRTIPDTITDAAWDEYRRRWRQGAYRASFFCEMVRDDIERRGPRPAVLDIGCGRGFDGEAGLQNSLATLAGQYIGIEPDTSLQVADCFTKVHRSTLEDAPVVAESIDVALAVFVLEHLPEPQAFFDKLYQSLAPGGVFWGFTIDRRHYFAMVSRLAEMLGVKGWLLRRMGIADAVRGGNHYRTLYRTNTPGAIRRYAARFHCIRWMNLHQTGQLDAYLPQWGRPISRCLDWGTAAFHLPGPMLVVRLEKSSEWE